MKKLGIQHREQLEKTSSVEIAVINDDPAIFDLIQLTLQVGWPEAKPISIKPTLECIQAMKPELPKVIVFDLRSWGETGLKLLKTIHNNLDAPILALTPDNNDRKIAKAFSCGVAGCQTKPLHPMEFLARVKAIIREENHRFVKVKNGERVFDSVTETGDDIVGQCPKCTSILIYRGKSFVCPVCGFFKKIIR
jgi:DNA-binding response OmpR family regulator